MLPSSAPARPGSACSKYLIEAGFDVTVFEIGTQIGGLWCFRNDNDRSSCYRTLHINTSRGVTHFHDLISTRRCSPFPTTGTCTNTSSPMPTTSG